MNLNDLIKLANLLDANGEHEAASEVDGLIVQAAEEDGIVLSPETLESMQDSVKEMNTNLQQTIEFLQTQGYEIVEPQAETLTETPVEDKVASMDAVFEKLATIADTLDAVGALDEANMIDGFIQKHAEGVYDVVDWKEEADTEQSKRYDDRHHHNLQVREPKRDQERVDREGRGEHHKVTHREGAVHDLGSRYCPDHIGVMMGRVGESIYQCPLDGKTYNRDVGYVDYEGNQVPGGSVAAQTPDSSGYEIPHRIFDSREKVLNAVN